MRQGEVYWLVFGGKGSEPAGRRPAVVVQDDRYNATRIQTTVVAAITSNPSLAAVPGNVRPRKGEAHLDRPSVINLTQLRTVDRDLLRAPIGVLGPAGLAEVRRGLALVFGIDTDAVLSSP